MEVFEELDYKLIFVLEKYWAKMKKCSKLSYKYIRLQDEIVSNVLMKMLGDEDARVRLAAAAACVK